MKQCVTREFRAKLTDEQKILCWKTFGNKRFTWNHLLDQYIQYGKANNWEVKYNNYASLLAANPFLKESDSTALNNVAEELYKACKRLFPQGRTPNFKQKGKDRRSYTSNCINNNIRFEEGVGGLNYLIMPKLKRVRIIKHRDIPAGGKIKRATIKETAGGDFYVAVVFEVEAEEPNYKDAPTGFMEALDYSMPRLFVSYSGMFDVTPEDLRWYYDIEEKLAKEQRKLNRMKSGSKNYYEQLHVIGKLHEHAANRRKDFLHKLSRKMADYYDVIVVETLDLQEMGKRGVREDGKFYCYGKRISDNAFGMFCRFLACKLRDQNKYLVKTPKTFASTQLCSNCGYKNAAAKDVSVREWTCPICGEHHDRDKNSCNNLLKEGRNIINRWTSGDSSFELTPDGVLSEKKPHSKIKRR